MEDWPEPEDLEEEPQHPMGWILELSRCILGIA